MTVGLRRDWPLAFTGMRRLARDANDTPAVMIIIQALEGPAIWRIWRRMQASAAGREQIARGLELHRSPLLTADYPAGTVGAAYRAFMGARHSARKLADCLIGGPNGSMIATPGRLPWFIRRLCDLHDVAHVLTGYDSDPQGEGCLQAWTFAQSGNFGNLSIALGSACLYGPLPVLEAYLAGRRARWLFDVDPEALFASDLEAARASLGIKRPRLYRSRRVPA
jgi:ubiquinone biosynthesis protein COQ4